MRLLLMLFTVVMLMGQGRANTCALPTSIVGKTILIRANGVYSPLNTLADSIIEYVFKEKTYEVTILNSRKMNSGTYFYRRLNPMLARFSVISGSGESLTLYSQTFVCETNNIGYSIFSQTKGLYKPDIKQNFGIFIIQDQDE
ncbi:hypothetical protein [uncultured Shewanella sp.]|uniref:hypothetical protein n=1 Tax=uncultured Shewanella sp. TaxID=173975 RepID=UPI002608B00F|nr:hypothetical protein [uncultured Shewanella sp.]